MSTKLAVLIGVVTALLLFAIPLVLVLLRSRKSSVTSSTQGVTTGSVPSVYTVRANRLYLARRRIIPRLFMWGLIVAMVAFALYLFKPNMFLDTIKAVGPSIATGLMGFAVLGIGQSWEEKYESYEFSYLGWGGASVLWVIALITLFR